MMRAAAIPLSRTRRTGRSLADVILVGLVCLVLLAPLRADIYRIVPFGEPVSFAALGLLWTWLVLAPQRSSGRTYLLLVLLPGVVIALAAVWALRFTVNYGGGAPASMLAQRWFLLWLLYPIGRALFERGVAPGLFWRAVAGTVALVLAAFALRQLTWDLESLVRDPAMAPHIRHDAVRGYRLYHPQYVLFFSGFVALAGALSPSPASWRHAALLGGLAAVYAGIYSRLHLGFSLVVLAFHVLVMSGRGASGRDIRLVIVLLFGAATAIALIPALHAYALTDPTSGAHRLATIDIIVRAIGDHPLWGAGAGSLQAVSLQDVFGQSFQPSDAGLVGIAFVYGIVGAALDLVLILVVLIRSVQAWRCCRPGDRSRAVALVWMALFFLVGAATFDPFVTPDSILVAVLVLLAADTLEHRGRHRLSEPTTAASLPFGSRP